MNENTAAAKSAATKALRTCRCGCGAPLGGKAAYRPGHDARHVSNLKRDLDTAAASSDRSQGDSDRIQQEVFAIFGQLKSTALRAKLGRAVDNDKEGLYNSFGDMGVYVPYSENPSLGGNGQDRWGRDLMEQFETANPADAPKARKAKDDAPAVADEPWITHEPIAKIKGEEVAPMWTESEGDEAPLEVKIGRWTYPARRRSNGKLERNVNRLGEGEWIPAEESQLVK